MIERPAHLRGLAEAAQIEEVRASLRHSLRNRLGAVRNAAFYLRRRVDSTALPAEDARVPRFFDMIDSEVTAATQLLDSKAPPEVPRGASAPLRAAVLSVTAGVRAPGIGVSVGAWADLAVAIERHELELAFFCLLENACDAAASAVAVEARREGASALLVVSDDGAGFAPGAKDRAFETFFTTRPGHAGLGLNVAKRIAERWGGGVSLDAGAERGTHATLRIPVAGGPAP